MVLGIQILGILFGLFMLYTTFIHRKKNEFNLKEYVLWTVLWVGFVVISSFPNILQPFTETLNLQRTMDLLLILGFIFVVGLLYNNYLIIKNTRKRVENVVQKIAVKEAKMVNKK